MRIYTRETPTVMIEIVLKSKFQVTFPSLMSGRGKNSEYTKLGRLHQPEKPYLERFHTLVFS